MWRPRPGHGCSKLTMSLVNETLKLKKNYNEQEIRRKWYASAGIKSHKFVFELKKNLFCQEIDELVCKKNGQTRKIGISLLGYGILEEEWVTDSQCHSVLGSTVSGES